MAQPLKNMVAIVTGAGSGLGRAIAFKMASQGAMVSVADINGDAATAAAKEISSQGGNAIGVQLDVTDEDNMNHAVEHSVNHFGTGRLDIMVSNAGFQHISPVNELDLSIWKKMLAVHLDGSFLATKASWNYMKAADGKEKGGSIIYMGSVHSREASLFKAPYVAAKHGIVGLCRSVSKEGGPLGITANVVCPGFVLTPLVEKQIPEQAEEEVVKNVMLRNTVDTKFSTLDDIANVCCFLGAFPTNALTGQSINFLKAIEFPHGYSPRS